MPHTDGCWRSTPTSWCPPNLPPSCAGWPGAPTPPTASIYRAATTSWGARCTRATPTRCCASSAATNAGGRPQSMPYRKSTDAPMLSPRGARSWRSSTWLTNRCTHAPTSTCAIQPTRPTARPAVGAIRAPTCCGAPHSYFCANISSRGDGATACQGWSCRCRVPATRL